MEEEDYCKEEKRILRLIESFDTIGPSSDSSFLIEETRKYMKDKIETEMYKIFSNDIFWALHRGTIDDLKNVIEKYPNCDINRAVDEGKSVAEFFGSKSVTFVKNIIGKLDFLASKGLDVNKTGDPDNTDWIPIMSLCSIPTYRRWIDVLDLVKCMVKHGADIHRLTDTNSNLLDIISNEIEVILRHGSSIHGEIINKNISALKEVYKYLESLGLKENKKTQ